MPVQAIVPAASAAARMPHNPVNPDVAAKKIQPIAKIAAGTKVATDITPSRDSQDERHCEKARHARSGWPRWKIDETSPPAASAKATAKAANQNQGSAGSNASGTPRPISPNSANPAPDAVVKKTIESAGCMVRVSSPRQEPVDPAQQSNTARRAVRSIFVGGGWAWRHSAASRRQVFVDRPVAELGQEVGAAAN